MAEANNFLQFGTLILMLFGTITNATDPCIVHTTINDVYRSTKYQLQKGYAAKCDDTLADGWYRFKSIAGEMMPETKPSPNSCGTVAPIWIRDTHPTTTGQEKEVTACTNVRNISNGCLMSSTISIKNCGSFYVYKLKRVYGCPRVYCAGNLQPCPKGQDGIVPNCKGTCFDGINNYTCRCDAGITGSLCNQTIYKCTYQSCFTGVQCTETASGITCGSCPIGMSGDGKTCSVKAELGIKMEWQAVYLDKESQDFKYLAHDLESNILDLYKNRGYNNVKRVRVISMRKGSIIVEFELVFGRKSSDPLRPLRESIKDGKMGTFTVDPNSLKIINEATDEPNPPAKKDLTLILILVGLGIVVFAVAIMLVLKFKNHPLENQIYPLRRNYQSSQLNENGKDVMEMKTSIEGPIQKKAAIDMESGSSVNTGFR